ncbi:hypothetical protein [Spirosoma pomorum]
MSVSSNSRKESTESYAAQQMHSTMGIAPELAQLNDKNLENELPSRVADSRDTDVPGDVTQAESLVAENDDKEGIYNEDIEESKRASWGQPPLPSDAEEATTDEDNPMTAYQQPEATDEAVIVTDADWNRSTSEGAIPATRANEPDRTLGNS